jgi:hypothetical protein
MAIPRGFQPGLRTISNLPKQVRFASAVALNRTAEEINAGIRQRMQRNFTIRDPRLLNYIAPLTIPAALRATREKPRVVLETAARGSLLVPFQEGEPKVGTPDRPVAIPTRQLRFSRHTIIPKRWFPANLGLTPKRDPAGQQYYALGRNAIRDRKTPIRVTKSGAVQIKGKNRTFVLDPRYHKGVSPEQAGVYIRIGPKRDDIRMLWRYIPSVPRPRILVFFETARSIQEQRFLANYQGALAFALRTAR